MLHLYAKSGISFHAMFFSWFSDIWLLYLAICISPFVWIGSKDPYKRSISWLTLYVSNFDISKYPLISKNTDLDTFSIFILTLLSQATDTGTRNLLWDTCSLEWTLRYQELTVTLWYFSYFFRNTSNSVTTYAFTENLNSSPICSSGITCLDLTNNINSVSTKKCKQQ